MKDTSSEAFVHSLQMYAKKQSHLTDTSPLPSFTHPVSVLIAQYSWQFLLITSFITAWIVLLSGFEFFFRIIHNIVI